MNALAPRKVYLSDGAYAAYEYGTIVITAENGICETNRVVLDPFGIEVLIKFLVQIYGAEKIMEVVGP